MLRTMAVEERLRRGRMEAKTRDAMFRAKIEVGAKCAPFVSQAILQTLKEVYPVEAEDLAAQVELGRVRMLVVAMHEPSGKKLGDCQKVSVLLTLDQPDDDDVRVHHGVTGLRRARLLRMTVEAFEQGGLLTHEDLAFRLLNCGLRTIVRGCRAVAQRGSGGADARAAAGYRAGADASRAGRAVVLEGTGTARDRSPVVPLAVGDRELCDDVCSRDVAGRARTCG